MGNCISFISYSKFKLRKKKYDQSDVDSNPEFQRAADSNAYGTSEKSRRGKDSGGHANVYNSSRGSGNLNGDHKNGPKHVHCSDPNDSDQSEKEIDKQRGANEHISDSASDQSNVLMINEKNKKKGKKKAKHKSKKSNEVDPKELHRNEADKGEPKSNINGKVQLGTSKGKNKKEAPQNGSQNGPPNEDNAKAKGTYNHHVDGPSKKNSSYYSNSINTNDLYKKNKKENLLNIKYSNMILNDIRDVDIIVVFLFSLFLYFNANNIVDMLDPNKKDRYFLRNSLNINHDIIKFPTFPKEIIDSFLKNDFTLLKKYIKNKCNKLKKKYKSTYLKKVMGSDEEGEGEQNGGEIDQKDGKYGKKKNFKYELKKKKEKCSFSKIVESLDRNECIQRDITEIPCDQNLPHLNITFIVRGAYCLYQKNTKPFQDKNTFFYKSPSYTCDAEISVACKKGRKLDFPNQDDFTIIQTNEWILIMVFDGHGPSGHDISNFAHVILPLLFSYNIERIFENPVRTMKTLFYMINCYLVNYSYCINNNINPININFIDYNLSGTTCTIILYNFETKKIYSAHTGDSRAVMGKQNQQTNTFSAYNITEDHKPSLKLEKDRIVAFGGEVKKLQGDVSYRVFVKNEMYPGLAMSRAIGDITSSFIGVTCEPTINIFDKSEEDKFIIVATDGIWEFISSEECVQMVSRKRKKKVHVAMEEIIKESWRRWERIDTVDDMTLVILYF
ncbi:protein phosphatase 2C domain containing protein [Plasmodium cynomolgi strain B]|uniref:Protein phosphatase 2C domain containing protein n=1 Tax=Plasmodium cynomolgi (strain B) TaxID=1120755 RepID=K6UY42_PLACD|nr:protein phosphatase 2C domain containing protein [Plasmodium cynomolgi strain B]GAB68759.1 protein phosphatase 2C domain containing protein [Plasmodium cynomolgi strain B]